MKTLSVRQPWASLIVSGEKTIENRSRPTRYRGRVLIQAGRAIDPDGMALVNEVLAEVGPVPNAAEWPTGAIIGCVTIVDCVTESGDEYFEGPFGYVLADPVEFDKPIPARGQLGLYNTPSLTVAMAAAMLGKSETTIRAQLLSRGIGRKLGRDYMITDSDFILLEAVPKPGRPTTRNIP